MGNVKSNYLSDQITVSAKYKTQHIYWYQLNMQTTTIWLHQTDEPRQHSCEGLQTAHRAAIMRAEDRAGLPHYYLRMNTQLVPFNISKKRFAAVEHADHNDLTPSNRWTSPTLLWRLIEQDSKKLSTVNQFNCSVTRFVAANDWAWHTTGW